MGKWSQPGTANVSKAKQSAQRAYDAFPYCRTPHLADHELGAPITALEVLDE